MGLVLYTLYTAEVPLSQHTYTATFVDDTTIMSINKNPVIASTVLQQSLNEIPEWMKLCRIMTNENKPEEMPFSFFKLQWISILA